VEQLIEMAHPEGQAQQVKVIVVEQEERFMPAAAAEEPVVLAVMLPVVISGVLEELVWL